MNQLVRIQPKEQALAEAHNELAMLTDLVLREYVPLHEYIDDHTPCNDRVRAYKFKQELPKKTEALGKVAKQNGLGLTARIEYHSNPRAKEHRQNIWMRFIEVDGYAACPIRLRFDFRDTGINDGIVKKLDWAHLEIDCYGSGQFWGEANGAVVLPHWFYQFLHPTRSTHSENESTSTAIQKYNNALVLRSQLDVSEGFLEGTHHIKPTEKHPSGLEMSFSVDTYRGGEARLMGLIVPVNLKQYRTKQ